MAQNFVEQASAKSKQSAKAYIDQFVQPALTPSTPENTIKPVQIGPTNQGGSDQIVPREQLLAAPQVQVGESQPLLETPEEAEQYATTKALFEQPNEEANHALYANGVLSNFGNAIADSWEQGWNRKDILKEDDAAFHQGGYTAEQHAEREARKQSQVDYGPVLGKLNIAPAAVQTVSDMARYTWEGREGIAPALTAYTAALLAASMTPAAPVAVGSSPLTLSGAIGIGITVDAATSYEYPLKRAEAFGELYHVTDFEGNRIPVDQAKALAEIIAGLQTGVETVGLHVVGKLIPGLDKFSGMPTPQLAKVLLENRQVRGYLTKGTTGAVVEGGVKAAAAVGTEVLEEEAVLLIGLAGEAYGTEGTLNKDVGAEMGRTAVETVGVMSLITAGPTIASVTSKSRRRSKIAKANRELATSNTNIVQDIISSSEHGLNVAHDMIPGSPMQGILDHQAVHVDDVRKLFQDDESWIDYIKTNHRHLNDALTAADKDPAKVIRFNKDSNAYVDLVALADRAGKTDGLNSIITYDGNPWDADGFSTEADPYGMTEGKPKAEKPAAPAARGVHRTDLYMSMVEARGAEEARGVMAIYDEVFGRLAKQTGQTVDDLYQKHQVSIMSKVASKRKQPLTKLKASINELMRGGTVTDKTIFGPSAVDFLKSEGGVNHPEVKEMFGDALGAAPRLTMHHARERLEEEGYLPPGSYDQEVYDLIDAELKEGKPHYKGDVFNQDDLTRRETVNALGDRLSELGIGMHEHDTPDALYQAFVAAELAKTLKEGVRSFWLTDLDADLSQFTEFKEPEVTPEPEVEVEKPSREERGPVPSNLSALSKRPYGEAEKRKATLDAVKNDDGVLRGFMEKVKEGFKVTLTGRANRSTLIHESAHVFLEILNMEAIDTPALATEMEGISKWAGFEVGQEISTEAHEKFARGFEKYLMEGRAPTKKLQPIFNKFKNWLLHIYTKIQQTDMEISDTAREFFALMLGAEDVANMAEQDLEIRKILEGLDALMDAESKSLVEAAMMDARDEIRRAVMRDLRKGTETDRAERRAELEAEVLAEVTERRMKDKVTGLYLYFTGKETGIEKHFGEHPKFNRQLVQAVYASRVGIARLGHLLTTKDSNKSMGVSPEAVVNAYGFKSVEDMFAQLTSLVPIREEVRAEVNRRIALEFQHQDIESRADEIMADKGTEITLHAYTRIFNRKSGGAPIVLEGLNERTKQKVRERAIGFIRPDEYLTAYKKAVRAMTDALDGTKGLPNYAIAAKAAQDAHVALISYKEAIKVVRFRENLPRKIRKFYSPGIQEMLRKASRNTGGLSFHNVMYNFLKSFNFTNIKLADLKANQNLDKLNAFLNDNNAVRTIADVQLITGFNPNYKELSYDQLQQVLEMANRIIAEAREQLKQDMEDRVEKKTATIAELKSTIAENLKKLDRKNTNAPGEKSILDRMKNALNYVQGYIVKMEMLLKLADGNTPGVWYNTFYGWMQEAANARNDITAPLEKELEAAGKILTKGLVDQGVPEMKARRLWDTVLGGKVEFLGQKMNRGKVLAIALNMGTVSGQDKLANGYRLLPGYDKFTPDNVLAELNKVMTKEDWEYVQAVWATVDKMKPGIKKFTEDVLLKDFKEVEGVDINTPFGVINGMYYPVVYDRGLTGEYKDVLKEANGGTDGGVQAIIDSSKDPADAMSAARASIQVNTGVTMERTGVVAPILLDLGVAHTHINDSAHMITHFEKVQEAAKMFDAMEATMIQHFGAPTTKFFKDTLLRVALNRRYIRPSEGVIDDAAGYMASAMTIFHLGYNPFTMAKQTYGLVNAHTDVEGKYMRKAIVNVMANVNDSVKSAGELSGFMRNYEANWNVNIAEVTEKMHHDMISSGIAQVRSHSFIGIAATQRLVSTIVWQARYNQGLEAHGDSDLAAQQADSAVRLTQGSGQIHDLAAYQTGRGLPRLLALFSTPLAAFSSTIMARGIRARQGEVKAFVELLPLLVAMPLLDGLMKTIWGEVTGEEDDDFLYNYMVNSYTSFMGTTIGTIPGGGMLSGKVYTGQFRSILNDYPSQIWGGVTSGEASGLITAVGLATKTPLKSVHAVAKTIEDEFE